MSNLNLNPSRRIPHYVGLTGVKTAEDVVNALKVGTESGFGTPNNHHLMFGALASAATINSAEPQNTNKPWRHVKGFNELVSVLGAASQQGIIGMVHMELNKSIEGDPKDAGDVITLVKALVSEGFLPAVQLNGILSPESIKRIVEETGAPLVLQLRKELTDRAEITVMHYVEKLDGLISEILVDPSEGSGKRIDVSDAVKWQELFESELPGVFSYGYAGGLGGALFEERLETTRIISEFRKKLGHTRFSLDVESKVHSPDGPIQDRLDHALLPSYYESVLNGLKT